MRWPPHGQQAVALLHDAQAPLHGVGQQQLAPKKGQVIRIEVDGQ